MHSEFIPWFSLFLRKIYKSFQGNFGTFVGQRMNFANSQCFVVQEASTSSSMVEQVSIQSNETITSVEQVYEREELSKNAKNPDAAAWIGEFSI